MRRSATTITEINSSDTTNSAAPTHHRNRAHSHSSCDKRVLSMAHPSLSLQIAGIGDKYVANTSMDGVLFVRAAVELLHAQ